tara:strand:+ start:1824 stop:2195 length:372 start_codon:yes stop_codon:yes gene_type:complete
MSKDSDEIISIKVAGVEYQLHCPKDEQRGLLNAADYLNKKIRKIKRQAKFLSIEKASVLAGLEVANELLNSDKVEISESNAQEVTSEQKIVENKEAITDKQNSNKTEDLSIKLVSEISELSKL